MHATDTRLDPTTTAEHHPLDAAKPAEPNHAPILWNHGSLDADLLDITWRDLAAFVEQLRELDVEVPKCWYVHGWIVYRLAALQNWHADAYSVESDARTAAEWWSLGLQPLARDWEPLLRHRDRHPPKDRPWAASEKLPPVEVIISGAVAERRGER